MSKSITREQVNAINAKMSNRFQLDTRFLVIHGEKQAVKSIKLDDETTLVATLTFRPGRDEKQNAWGQKFSVPNGKSHISLHLSVWHYKPDTAIAISYGTGRWINISEDMPRRNFSAIQKLTANYDDDTIMALFNDKQRNGEMIRVPKRLAEPVVQGA